MIIFVGDLVDAPAPRQLRIRHNHQLVVNDDGFIVHIAPLDANHEGSAFSDLPTRVIPPGSFLLPSFIDLHLHAPQFLYAGSGLDLPLMRWLPAYAFNAEHRIDNDPALARATYASLAARLIENGTGTVLLFGTIGIEANLILAEAMHAAGLRAFVGKLSMDIDLSQTGGSTPYAESSPGIALANARDFIHRTRELFAHHPGPHRTRVTPVLTPRFTPACSDDLLLGIGDLSRELRVPIQSHLAEAQDQLDAVQDRVGSGHRRDIDIFDHHGLLAPHAVFAHCTYLTRDDLLRLAARGSAVAHCPLSNAYFSGRPFNVASALNVSTSPPLHIGLGSDIAGGYTTDQLVAMRTAVLVSRMLAGAASEQQHATPSAAAGKEYARDTSNIEQEDEDAGEHPGAGAIDWRTALFLATRGGAAALGLPDGLGTFTVGAAFDAQEIRLYDPQTQKGVGALDFIDLELKSRSSVGTAVDPPQCLSDRSAEQNLPSNCPVLSFNPTHTLRETDVEKWWSIGDARNRFGMWVQGQELCRDK